MVVVEPQTITLVIRDTPKLQVKLTQKGDGLVVRQPALEFLNIHHYTVPGSSNLKHNRDEDPDSDESPATKAARSNQGEGAGARTLPEASSSTLQAKSDFYAFVSELAREIRGLERQSVTLLGDIAAGSDLGFLTHNTLTAKDSACKHCGSGLEPGEDSCLVESVD